MLTNQNDIALFALADASLRLNETCGEDSETAVVRDIVDYGIRRMALAVKESPGVRLKTAAAAGNTLIQQVLGPELHQRYKAAPTVQTKAAPPPKPYYRSADAVAQRHGDANISRWIDLLNHIEPAELDAMIIQITEGKKLQAAQKEYAQRLKAAGGDPQVAAVIAWHDQGSKRGTK